jgi:hypothetical protein
MSRERLLRPRWLVWLAVLWGAATVAAPRLGETVPLPPARAAAPAAPAEGAEAWLARHLLQARLAALGVSEADQTALWARLSPAEQTELAARAEELRAGGDPVAAGVAIAIIVAMVVILALELIGRRVISRPEGERP